MKKIIYLFVFSLLALSSCRKSFEDAKWDVEILTPLAHTALSVENLKLDSSLKVDQNGLLTYTFSQDLYSFKPFDQSVKPTVPPFKRELTLQSLELGAQKQTTTIYMNDIISSTSLQGFAVYSFFSRDIFPVPFVLPDPSFPAPFDKDIAIDTVKIDISTFFKTAVLTSGLLTFKIENNFRLDFDKMSIKLENEGDGTIVFDKTFADIKRGQSKTEVIDLAAQMNGKPIEGKLLGIIYNLQLSSPDGVTTEELLPFSPQDSISITMEISDVKVQSAEAIFPEQNVIDMQDTVKLQGLDAGMELTKLIVKNGYVKVRTKSTIPTELHMIYSIPSAIDQNGKAYKFTNISVAAPIGGIVEQDSNFYFEGYTFDLTGIDGSLTNTFYNSVIASIKPTPAPIPLSLDDTLIIELTIEDFEASYVEGYLGGKFFQVGPETSTIELPEILKRGGLQFETVKAQVVFHNGLGVPGELKIQTLSGTNTTNNKSVNLTNLPGAQFIKPATKSGNQIIPSITSFELEGLNDLVNITPDLMKYAIDFNVNPNGNTPPFSNFVETDQEVKVKLDLEIPLNVSADNLILHDTLAFLEKTTNRPEALKDGKIYLIVENGFPLEVTADLYLLDENKMQIDSLISDEIIASALLENGLVKQSTKSKITFDIPQARLSNILRSRYVVVKMKLDTEGKDFREIHSDYILDASLVGDFGVEIKGDL